MVLPCQVPNYGIDMRYSNCLAILVCLLISLSSSAKIRPMTSQELSQVRAGYSGDDGSCVNNGACGAAVNFNQPCQASRAVDGNGNYIGLLCDTPNMMCKTVDTPGPNNITCTGGLGGSGCTGNTAAPCVTRVTSKCIQ